MRPTLSIAAGPVARLDAAAVVETPEHIAFQFEVAGPFQRVGAYATDVAIRAAGLFAIAVVAGLLQFGFSRHSVGDSILILTWFAVEWFYHVVLEWKLDGQTPGKRLFGLRVVRTGGYPITATDALLRNFLRVADWMPPPLYLVGVAVCATDMRFRRIGDLVADTMVVIDAPRALTTPAVTEVVPQALLAALPARLPIDAEERRTLDALVRRTRSIGRVRLQEICQDYAGSLADRLGVSQPTDGVAFVHAVYARLKQDDARRRGDHP